MAKRRQPNKKNQTKSKGKSKASVSKKTIVASNSTQNWLNNKKLHLIGLFIFGFLLYGQTISYDYTLDDSIVISDNIFVQGGVDSIGHILGNDTFLGFFKEKKNLVAGGRYRPLSLVTFAVEHEILKKDNPAVSHFINVLLYSLTGLLLYLLLLQLFNPTEDKQNYKGFFFALAATILFMAHPVHTEAVANIKGRDEIMSLLGSLGAFYLAIRYVYTEKIHYVLTAAVVFLLALLSKENAITFVAVIPLGIYFFTKAKPNQIGGASVAFTLMGILFMMIRANVLGEAASINVSSNELMNNPFVDMNGGQKMATIFHTLGLYIKLLIFPHPLTYDYYPYHIQIMEWSDWQVILSLVLYLAMGIFATLKLVKKDIFAFCIIFYIATLSPVSNIVFPVGAFMSERFIYMPSVGFTLAIAALLHRVFIKNDTEKIIENWLKPMLIVGVIALLFSLKTVTRNTAWKDNYTLFATDVEVSVNSAKINNAMGGTLIDQALLPQNQTRKTEFLQKALVYLQKATEIHPTYSNAWLLQGNAYVHLGQYDNAVKIYEYVTQNFNNDNAVNNLGIAYHNMGKDLIEKQGNFAEGVKALEQARQYQPNNVEILGMLGMGYGNLGRTEQAAQMFTKVIEINPNDARAYLNLGYVYLNQGNTEAGNQYLNKAYELDPTLKR